VQQVTSVTFRDSGWMRNGEFYFLFSPRFSDGFCEIYFSFTAHADSRLMSMCLVRRPLSPHSQFGEFCQGGWLPTVQANTYLSCLIWTRAILSVCRLCCCLGHESKRLRRVGLLSLSASERRSVRVRVRIGFSPRWTLDTRAVVSV